MSKKLFFQIFVVIIWWLFWYFFLYQRVLIPYYYQQNQADFGYLYIIKAWFVYGPLLLVTTFVFKKFITQTRELTVFNIMCVLLIGSAGLLLAFMTLTGRLVFTPIYQNKQAQIRKISFTITSGSFADQPEYYAHWLNKNVTLKRLKLDVAINEHVNFPTNLTIFNVGSGTIGTPFCRVNGSEYGYQLTDKPGTLQVDCEISPSLVSGKLLKVKLEEVGNPRGVGVTQNLLIPAQFLVGAEVTSP